MDFVLDSNQCNQITNDDTWMVIKKYFEQKGFIRHHLNSYNKFVEHDIQKIVSEMYPIIVNSNIYETKNDDYKRKNKLVLTFGDISINNTYIQESDGTLTKMTPDILDITEPAKAAMAGGASGVAAINTIPSILNIDLETLAPMPAVEGHSTPGGYSYYAVKPIALRMVSQIGRGVPDAEISGIGGVISSREAIEFILMGSSTVQVCTGVMLQGYEMIEEMCEGLSNFMEKHGFQTVREFVGNSLQYLTTHHDLADKRLARKAESLGVNRDNNWTGDIKKETDELVSK